MREPTPHQSLVVVVAIGIGSFSNYPWDIHSLEVDQIGELFFKFTHIVGEYERSLETRVGLVELCHDYSIDVWRGLVEHHPKKGNLRAVRHHSLQRGLQELGLSNEFGIREPWQAFISY